MLIDESKMAVDSSFSFLNLRKQRTNLKLKLLFKIEALTLSLSKIAPLNFLRSTNSDRKRPNRDRPTQVASTHYRDRPIQIAHYAATEANHRYTNSAKQPKYFGD